ncbi:MAG: hypothetical protein ACK5LT_06500 [Lachnospirales bacterium]
MADKRKPYYNLEHQKKYNEKLKTFTVRFNMEKAEDVELYNHFSDQANKNAYIKKLIHDDFTQQCSKSAKL